MKLYQMKQEDENMSSPGSTLHTSPKRHREDIDNPSPLTLMTFSRILTSTARTGMPVIEDTLMNTPGPTRRPTADTRDTFKEVSDQESSMICLMT